jgi:D-sedoheptulose 7-phosphate isomerase
MAFDTPYIRARLARSADTIMELAEHAATIERLGRRVRDALAGGGKLLTCGNGGSAAQAMHLAEELIGRYKRDRRPFAAICLNADPTALTCIANDYGFDEIFARQVEGLARPGDALIVFSTSGNSPNVVRALKTAKERGIETIGLLGKGGGECAPLCDEALVVRSAETECIQEAHQVVLHMILEAVEGTA